MVDILLIEDEQPIREMIQFALGQADFTVLEAENAQQAFAKLAIQTPDLILLDMMLPQVSGLEITKKLKQQAETKDIPIIMLTARAEEESKVKALEMGADDYVVKPFSPKELIARIKAVLRRGLLLSPEGEMKLGKLCMNTNEKVISIAGEVLNLTSKEYKVLHFFLTHQGRSYNREQILNHIWGGVTDIDERTVDVQIGRLRKVLQPYGYAELIKTIRGVGYKFSLDDVT